MKKLALGAAALLYPLELEAQEVSSTPDANIALEIREMLIKTMDECKGIDVDQRGQPYNFSLDKPENTNTSASVTFRRAKGFDRGCMVDTYTKIANHIEQFNIDSPYVSCDFKLSDQVKDGGVSYRTDHLYCSYYPFEDPKPDYPRPHKDNGYTSAYSMR